MQILSVRTISERNGRNELHHVPTGILLSPRHRRGSPVRERQVQQRVREVSERAVPELPTWLQLRDGVRGASSVRGWLLPAGTGAELVYCLRPGAQSE